jgi:hypothetical protein
MFQHDSESGCACILLKGVSVLGWLPVVRKYRTRSIVSSMLTFGEYLELMHGVVEVDYT